MQGSVGQSVALANLSPEEIVMDWIIDDGQPGRPNRVALFNGDFQALGAFPLAFPHSILLHLLQITCVARTHAHSVAQVSRRVRTLKRVASRR